MQAIGEIFRRVWRSIAHSARPMPARAAPAGRSESESVEIPTYVEPVLSEVLITCETRKELAEGELDPDALLHGVEPSIGLKNSPGVDYYNAALVVPDWLKRECPSGGFEWGRHIILTDKVDREATYRKLMTFLQEYCVNSAGAPEDSEWKLAQLGFWEFEDIDGGMPGRPRWHIRARLMDLWSPDADLDTFAPSGEFGIRVRARIGAEGGIEAGADSAVFEFLLCTPDWLGKRRDLSQLLLCSNIAFMGTFDLEVLRRNVASACAELKGYTAEEAIRKMDRYAERVAV